jgi:hypothetical protein
MPAEGQTIPAKLGGLGMKLDHWMVAAAIAAIAIAAPARADQVTDWMSIAANIGDTGDGPFDPAVEQSGSKLTLAMFEAANAVDRRYESWLKLPAAPAGASGDAAVATAAHDVLVAIFPTKKPGFDDAYLLAMANVTDAAARDVGVAVGHAAATAALAAGGADPAAGHPAPYLPKQIPGAWQANMPSLVTTDELTLRPWFMTSPAQFRPGPPVALSSARWVKDLDEVRRIGAKDSRERSAVDSLRAKFWAPYSSASAEFAVASQPGRSLVRNARFYALVSMVSDDAGLANTDAKLHYGFWRPVSAIRSGGGNPAITADPKWEPLLRTPIHPEYTCGHCTFAAALAAVLKAEGPPPPGGYPFTNSRMPGLVVTVATPEEYVRQVSWSRICAGVHYSFTAEATEAMAYAVAANGLAKFARPLK